MRTAKKLVKGTTHVGPVCSTCSTCSNLLEALNASEDVDMVRMAVEVMLQERIEAEATAVIGAGPHQRSDARAAQRSGPRPRTLFHDRGGSGAAAPKLRAGSVFPSLLDQFDVIATLLGRQSGTVETMLREASDDVTAFADFRVARWKTTWSTRPLERVHKEIKRRTDVVGVPPSPRQRRRPGKDVAVPELMAS